MRDRWIGMLVGVAAVGATYGLAFLPFGWAISGVLVGLTGWVVGSLVRQLRLQAERDELTGMANRRPFERALEREWEKAIRSEHPLSLLFIDVDDFGLINKRYGHLTGDEALRSLCRLMRQNIRKTDLAARWGGEEFVILLPGTDLGQACAMAERIRSVVERSPIRDRDLVLGITVSTGVASWPGTAARSPLDLLRQAIQGQAAAKVHKNSVQIVS